MHYVTFIINGLANQQLWIKPCGISHYTYVLPSPMFLIVRRLSVSNDLRVDAKRDLRDISASRIEVHPLNKVNSFTAFDGLSNSFCCVYCLHGLNMAFVKFGFYWFAF